jgi:hypothetical protein
MSKRSSLLQTFVNYRHKKCYNVSPRATVLLETLTFYHVKMMLEADVFVTVSYWQSGLILAVKIRSLTLDWCLVAPLCWVPVSSPNVRLGWM